MGVATSKENKDKKPVDATKPSEVPKEVVYDPKVPIKFEQELNTLDLMFGFCNFKDKENNSSNFYISCIRRDKDLVVVAVNGEVCFEKIVNCYEFEDLVSLWVVPKLTVHPLKRKLLDIKIKRGSVSMVQIFREFQNSIEKKKLAFTVDETQQNGKLAVELTVNKIRTELGFKMKPLTENSYERVFESFLNPLIDYYFKNFEESENDEIRLLQKICRKLEEQLSYLEYCKMMYEEQEKKRPSPTHLSLSGKDLLIVVEEPPPLVISSSQISIPTLPPSTPSNVLKSLIKKLPVTEGTNMTPNEVVEKLLTTKKKLVKHRCISHLDVDAFNCVVRTLLCGKIEKKTTVYEIVNDTLETVKNSYKNREKEQTRSNTPSWDPQINLKSALMKISSWEFDVFEISDKPMVSVGFYIFLENDLMRKFEIPEQTLINFLNQVEYGYNNNPFHNSRRAVEVLQAFNFFIHNSGLESILSDELIFASIIATIILDFSHPGFNNTFQMNTDSYLSTLYNNRSVLENHHLTGAFEILCAPENNILKGLSQEQYQDVRETIIQIVLATDMSSHSYTLNRFKAKVDLEEADFFSKEDSRLLLQMSVKLADISYTFRETNQYLKWAGLLEEEFFIQGDYEKKMGFHASVYGDRSRSLQRHFQRTYLSSITNPMLSTFIKAFPKLSFLQEYLLKNEAVWPSPTNSSSFKMIPVSNIIEMVK